MPTPEVIFTVHPRPTSNDPALDRGSGSLTELSRSLTQTDLSKLNEEIANSRDSIFGDIIFLMRYMLGRY